jgi:hypothetical protein
MIGCFKRLTLKRYYSWAIQRFTVNRGRRNREAAAALHAL